MGTYCMYLRKSRTDLEAEAHGEGETLSRHKTALTALAQRMNIKIEKIYEEIVSGETIAARPQMQRLLSEVGAGEWTGVLVMEIERLARGDTMDQGLVAQTFKYSNTKIITPIKTFDPSNEFDEEYFEFGLFMARREFTITNRRLVRGRQASAMEGKYVGSVPPYGYKKVKLEGQKGFTLEIDDEKAKVVQMIFDWYVNGTEINGKHKVLGLHAIATRLNELGIKSQVGKDYWTVYAVRNMIANPVYIGKIRWGYRKVQKIVDPDGTRHKLRTPAKKGEYILCDGLHEPIISEELFQKAQETIGLKKFTTTKSSETLLNPFSGILYCAKCGASISRTKSSKNQNVRLGCNRAGCKNVSTHFYMVEERILSILESWTKEYSVDSKELKTQDNLSAKIKSAISAAEKSKKKLENQLNTVYNNFEQGIYSEKVFRQRSAALEEQISETDKRLTDLNAELKLIDARIKAQIEFIPQVKHLLEVYNEIDAEEKNRLLKNIVYRITYEKDANGKYRGSSADDFQIGILPRLPNKD